MMLLTFVFFIFSFHCIRAANILGIFPFPSLSHQRVFHPISRELSLKGHKVTMVTTNPLNDSSLTNLTEINASHVYQVWNLKKLQDVLSKDANVFQNLDSIFSFLEIMTEALLSTTEFQTLLSNKDKQFNLVLTECHFPVLFSLKQKFGAPMIVISSFGLLTSQYDLMGNLNHPVLYPDLLLGVTREGLSLWQKAKNVLYGMWDIYYHYYHSLPSTHKIALKYFGDDTPYLGNLEKNISMLFSQGNLFLYPPRARVPMIMELGQLHIKPVKPLPKDLQQILDNAKEGVVYFSLGSNIKSVNLDKKLQKVIIEALSELPYKVIWKWESDFLPNKPPNVITRKWLPQQDLLAHPNIRVFVTQGGLQSTEEAICREVPIVGLPFASDQPIHTQRMMELGIGISLDPNTVTKEQMKRSIMEISENKSYKKRIKKVRDILVDKPMTSIESFIWWSEYIIRHREARHLRSPSADISWLNYLMLDIFCIFIIAISFVTYSCYRIVKFIIAKPMNTKKVKNNLNNFF